jgi:hypothetical protein
MAEMDIGFGPGKFNPDLNTQMGGIDPLLQKASRIKSPEEGIGVAVELAGEERRLGQQETQARIKKEKAMPEIEAAFKAEEGKYIKEARTREQDVMAEAEQAMSQFTVSKETLGGMATLASIIGVLGSLAGNTGGRQAGLGAIKSMTGMMAGYQKGRADEFRRDQIEFDKQYKIMTGKLDRASKEFDRAISMMPYNMAEAQKIKNTALAELNSDIITAVDAKQGIVRANTILKQAVDVANKERDRANQLNIATLKATGKPLKGKELADVVGLDSLSVGLRKLEQNFKPEYAGLGIFGVGAELQYEAMRRLGTEEGKKAIQWWSEYNRLQAPNRHALFGATLTGNELKNYQEFTAKKSDDPGVVLNQVKDQLAYTDALSRQRRRTYEAAGYTVPKPEEAPDFSNTYGEQAAPSAPSSTMPEAGGTTPTTPTAPAAPSAPAQKPMPTGTRLKAYADANFGGDQQAAKDYLTSQGYK